MPGAARVAGRIRRLADEIDESVVGQLWIQVCAHDSDESAYVAKKILDHVSWESMAELGVGALANSRDEAWAMSVVVDAFDPELPADDGSEERRRGELLNDLLQRAIDSGTLTATSCSTCPTRPSWPMLLAGEGAAA